MGDVYVRGSLRTYAQYLGLSADKVVELYARHAEDPAPPTAVRPGGRGAGDGGLEDPRQPTRDPASEPSRWS